MFIEIIEGSLINASIIKSIETESVYCDKNFPLGKHYLNIYTIDSTDRLNEVFIEFETIE